MVSESLRPAKAATFAAREAGLSDDQVRELEQNRPFGAPKEDPASEFPPTSFVVRQGYALENSSVDRIPLWVCEHVTPAEVRRDPAVQR